MQRSSKLWYLRDVSLISIPVTLTRTFLDRLGGTLALMNGPHQRMTQSRPSGSWHGTHGPRITNWGPNRGRPAPWPSYVYRSLSFACVISLSLSLCLPAWIRDRLTASSLVVYQICSGVTRRYIASRASWSLCLVYMPGIRKIIERERTRVPETEINKRIRTRNHVLDL